MPVDIEARVIRNTRLSADYNVLALAAPEIAAATAPGQFVMVRAGCGGDPLLRRPFSVFETLGLDGITLLSKRVGATTAMLYDAVEGDVVSCLGPLGQSFSSVDPPSEGWMVAGGVGLAPFATLADALVASRAPATLFYGARTGDELFYLDWFTKRGVTLALATEDGSRGDYGRVTVPLERALRSRNGRLVTIYACGPEPMLAAVARLAADHGVPSQVSVERVMGCGMGGCYSCVISVRDAHGGSRFVRSCIGGPVFDGTTIDWEAP
jgi:dihydroorotate dehydrogenase electron transfer subunit